ncbi:MAG: hypothetical protein QXI36_07785 [Candidatus Bathyarchaeia archaeon]
MPPVSVNVQPGTGVCNGFIDRGGECRERSVELAFIKIRFDKRDFILSWTCNLAEKCHNKECFYARSKPEKLTIQGF